MAFHVYILRCAGGSYYVGHTDNLERRVAEHQHGGTPGWTRRRLPITLVYSEWFQTRDEACGAERQIKGWGRAKKEALIAGDWERVARLAKRGGGKRD